MSFSKELHVKYEYDFLLFGLSSAVRDYKLAWELNQALQIRLVRSKDLIIDFNKDNSIVISNFIFKTTHCTFRLLKNKSCAIEEEPQYLLPDQKQADYLLMIKDSTETINSDNISARLASVRDIDAHIFFDANSLSFKENLIF